MRRKRSFWIGQLAGTSLAFFLLLAAPGRGFAADATDAAKLSVAAANTEAISQSLRKVMEGAPISGVADLRAIQTHVQQISDSLRKCTIGVQVGNAWGSGVIISKDGYVLTAAHVAGQPNKPCVFTLSDGREVKGKTLGLHRTTDAGLMKITDPGEYPHADLANSVKDQQWCLSLGHPGGYQSERGTVLRLGQVLLVTPDAITTDCTLVGGDSGGPLFDLNGRVIGINSRIGEHLYTNLHVPVGIFQDPEDWQRMLKGRVWGRMMNDDPGWLGVQKDESSKEAKIGGFPSKSPAERQGLMVGDVILELDEKKTPDFDALSKAVSDCAVNESVKIKVRRGDKVLEIPYVRLERRPQR
jgi:serine protease Do